MTIPNNNLNLKQLLEKFSNDQDPMFSMLEFMCHELMEIEVSDNINANKGEHTKDRKTHRSGTRLRKFDTRLGTMYLIVPKVRNGGYVPFFIKNKKRSEQALFSVIQEAYVNGVSTRKIEKLAKSMGIENISKSSVSNITKGLNEKVKEFRQRKLKPNYPVIWVDALYEKIRYCNEIRNMAVQIVCGINETGEREILALKPMLSESCESYKELFEDMKERGLEKVNLIVSDCHKGLKKAISESFAGSSWQRCKVHFMRNVLSHIPHKNKEEVSKYLKLIWEQPDYESALKYGKELILSYEKKYSKGMEILEEGLEESLQYYNYEKIDSKKISSTNILERLNKEIRRRTRVVGIFPSEESYINLVSMLLLEYEENWSGITYISEKHINN